MCPAGLWGLPSSAAGRQVTDGAYTGHHTLLWRAWHRPGLEGQSVAVRVLPTDPELGECSLELPWPLKGQSTHRTGDNGPSANRKQYIRAMFSRIPHLSPFLSFQSHVLANDHLYNGGILVSENLLFTV